MDTACGEAHRQIRISGVSDEVFGVGGSGWVLFDCLNCGVAYLDPRPNEPTIGRAYANYYTHAASGFDVSKLFWRRNDRGSRLLTGYINARYGYSFTSGLRIGELATRLRPQLRAHADFSIAHLPKPRSNSSRLLDVGCGTGNFVGLARSLGYRAMGVEPDPDAAAVGQRDGLDVRVASLPDPNLNERGFEHVTMAHVLEHIHRPGEALAQCFEMLAPGGRIWISQPNVEAIGLQVFGKHWRGLETPRHLTLFSLGGLTRLLERAGFVRIRRLPSEEAADFIFSRAG